MRGHVQKVGQQYAAQNNDYFTALFDGGFEKQDFVETQVQFELAVTHFVNPMRALAAKVLDVEMRSGIAQNITDELGGGVQEKSHSATFRSFLARLDATSLDSLEQREVWPEVAKFNAMLDAACAEDQVWRGAAVMGMIKRVIIVDSSDRICVEIKGRNIVYPVQLGIKQRVYRKAQKNGQN